MARWLHVETISIGLRKKKERSSRKRRSALRSVIRAVPHWHELAWLSDNLSRDQPSSNASAERASCPTMSRVARGQGPAHNLRAPASVSEFPVLAFSVSYEMEITGSSRCSSSRNSDPRRRARRDPSADRRGGPLTFSNPLPLAPFVDLIILGEAEELIHELLDEIDGAAHRSVLLDRLASRLDLRSRRGLAIGSVAKAMTIVFPPVADRDAEHRAALHVPRRAERGCSRGCTYCVMRRTTNAACERCARAHPRARSCIGASRRLVEPP